MRCASDFSYVWSLVYGRVNALFSPSRQRFRTFFWIGYFLTGALLFERTDMEKKKTDEPRHMLPCCKAWACVLQKKGDETICLYFDMSM